MSTKELEKFPVLSLTEANAVGEVYFKTLSGNMYRLKMDKMHSAILSSVRDGYLSWNPPKFLVEEIKEMVIEVGKPFSAYSHYYKNGSITKEVRRIISFSGGQEDLELLEALRGMFDTPDGATYGIGQDNRISSLMRAYYERNIK